MELDTDGWVTNVLWVETHLVLLSHQQWDPSLIQGSGYCNSCEYIVLAIDIEILLISLMIQIYLLCPMSDLWTLPPMWSLSSNTPIPSINNRTSCWTNCITSCKFDAPCWSIICTRYCVHCTHIATSIVNTNCNPMQQRTQ